MQMFSPRPIFHFTLQIKSKYSLYLTCTFPSPVFEKGRVCCGFADKDGVVSLHKSRRVSGHLYLWGILYSQGHGTAGTTPKT